MDRKRIGEELVRERIEVRRGTPGPAPPASGVQYVLDRDIMWVSCIMFLQSGMCGVSMSGNAGTDSSERAARTAQEPTGAQNPPPPRQAKTHRPNTCSTSTGTFRPSSHSSPTNCRAARPWSIRSCFGVNVTEWQEFVAARDRTGNFGGAAFATSSVSIKGRSAGRSPAMEERGLVSIRADRKDGRTHSISLTGEGIDHPRPGDRGRARSVNAACSPASTSRNGKP